MILYLFHTMDKYGNTIRKGALTDNVDVLIEDVAPEDTTADRHLHDIPEFLRHNYPDKYVFDYKKIEVEW